jgi:hypothetical protein
LDGRPTVLATDHEQYIIFSPHGTYTVTAHRRENTVTITNLPSQIPSQFIDTGTTISGLALTGNVLLVVDLETIVAWRLTEEGLVDGVFGNRRAGRGDSIWTISPMRGITSPLFAVEGQAGFIALNGVLTHVYNTGTGKGFEHILELIHFPERWYHLGATSRGRYHLRYDELSRCDGPSEDNWPILQTTLREGWVHGHEGKHRLWLPVEWRTTGGYAKWFHDIATLQLELPGGELTIIKF